MKIKQLIISNFRQFIGEQTIEFADRNNNVTIVLGQNGAGKTGIYRAVLFALFGDERLSQDPTNGDVHLINEQVMREAGGSPCTATVTLTFEYGDDLYEISRSVRGRYDGRNFLQQESNQQNCKLIINNEQTYNDRVEVDSKIEAIMRRDIREFFFFDAESLQMLDDLGNSNSVKRRISNGILQLLQVQDLRKASETTEALKKEIMRKARQLNNGDQATILQKKVEEIEDSIKSRKKSIKNFDEDLEAAENELKDKSSRYEAAKASIEQSKDIEQLQDQTKQIQETIDQRLDNMVGQVKEGASQLFSSILFDVRTQVESLRKASSDNIPKFILKQSLSDEICALCGHKLNDDPEAQNHVEELLELFKYSESATYLNNIEQGLAEVEQHRDDYNRSLSNSITTYYRNSQDLKQKQGLIDTLSEQLGANDQEIAEFKSLGNTIENIKKDIFVKQRNIEQLKKDISDLQKQHDKEEQQLLDCQKNNQIVRNALVEANFLDQIITNLDTIIDDYGNHSREQIEITTLSLFKRFIAVKDINLIAKVTIKKDYQFRVQDNLGHDITADLSKGQEQILSLAFVMALAQVASEGRSEMAFPLFMDTPFARIDGDNRDHLINEIPQITSQWILLLTDTEFTTAERDQFKKQGSVGSIYRLNNRGGVTTIDRINDLSLIELRGEN